MKVIPRGTTWQVHFDDASGNRQRISTKVRVDPRLADKGKALASLKAIEIMRDHLASEIPAEIRKKASGAATLAYALHRSLADRWSGQKSEKERRYVVGQICRDVGYWPLKSIDFTRLQDYGKELEREGDAPATRNRKMSCIHAALHDAKLRGEIDALPPFPHYREDNIKERYLTQAEEKTLLESMAANTAPGDAEAQYMLAVVPFLLDTGMRASEIMLKPEQDLGDRVWLPHGSTKNNKGRTVPLTARAREALDKILASPIHAELLNKKWGKKEHPATQWLGLRFRTACKRAGIKGVTLHTLRHTCASRLVQAGVSLYIVRDWLGHSTIKTTERYAHLGPTTLGVALAALEARNGTESLLQATINAGKSPAVRFGTETEAKTH